MKGGGYRIFTREDNKEETLNRNDFYKNQEKNKQYYPIPQSDITVGICEGIMKLREGIIDRLTGSKIEIDLGADNKIRYEMESSSIPQKLWFTDLDRATSVIRASQVQLFQYILYQFNMQKSKNIRIDISDYFRVRNIKRRKENMDRFFQDLAILLGIGIEMHTKVKGEKQVTMGKIMNFKGYIYACDGKVRSEFLENKKVDYAVIELGSWVDKLSLNQFVLADINIFRYNSKIDWITIMLSIKFGQLIRTNIGRLISNGYCNLKIKTIFEYLNISESDLKKQGLKHYWAILLNSLSNLEKEGYRFDCIPYISGLGYKEILEIKIQYSNEELLDKYRTIRRKNVKKS